MYARTFALAAPTRFSASNACFGQTPIPTMKRTSRRFVPEFSARLENRDAPSAATPVVQLNVRQAGVHFYFTPANGAKPAELLVINQGAPLTKHLAVETVRPAQAIEVVEVPIYGAQPTADFVVKPKQTVEVLCTKAQVGLFNEVQALLGLKINLNNLHLPTIPIH